MAAGVEAQVQVERKSDVGSERVILYSVCTSVPITLRNDQMCVSSVLC